MNDRPEFLIPQDTHRLRSPGSPRAEGWAEKVPSILLPFLHRCANKQNTVTLPIFLGLRQSITPAIYRRVPARCEAKWDSCQWDGVISSNMAQVTDGGWHDQQGQRNKWRGGGGRATQSVIPRARKQNLVSWNERRIGTTNFFVNCMWRTAGLSQPWHKTSILAGDEFEPKQRFPLKLRGLFYRFLEPISTGEVVVVGGELWSCPVSGTSRVFSLWPILQPWIWYNRWQKMCQYWSKSWVCSK